MNASPNTEINSTYLTLVYSCNSCVALCTSAMSIKKLKQIAVIKWFQQEGFQNVCLFVCLSAGLHKTPEQISLKLGTFD